MTSVTVTSTSTIPTVTALDVVLVSDISFHLRQDDVEVRMGPGGLYHEYILDNGRLRLASDPRLQLQAYCGLQSNYCIMIFIDTGFTGVTCSIIDGDMIQCLADGHSDYNRLLACSVGGGVTSRSIQLGKPGITYENCRDDNFQAVQYVE